MRKATAEHAEHAENAKAISVSSWRCRPNPRTESRCHAERVDIGDQRRVGAPRRWMHVNDRSTTIQRREHRCESRVAEALVFVIRQRSDAVAMKLICRLCDDRASRRACAASPNQTPGALTDTTALGIPLRSMT